MLIVREHIKQSDVYMFPAGNNLPSNITLILSQHILTIETAAYLLFPPLLKVVNEKTGSEPKE